MSDGTKDVDRSTEGFLAGGGEMGERIRAFDWPKTPLGPLAHWPQSLRSATSILLPSKAQIVLFWGPDLITLYNDAYRPVFGGKHPDALGQPIREAWRELWPAGLKELFENVLATGEAFWAKDRPFYMERHGYPEETFFDVSYDPVRDESGHVGGVFCIVSETTTRVVGERRLKALRDLGAVATQAHSVAEAWEFSRRVLGSVPLDVPFADADLEDRGGWPLGLQEAAALGDSLVSAPGPWPEPARKVMVLPLVERPGEGGGKIALGVSSRLAFDEDYLSFFQLVAGQVAASIAAARAAEAERRRAEALAEIDRAKTQFFSNVSHEFRTPLTLMLAPVEELLARSHSHLPPASREQLAIVNRNGQRLLRLVNTLLDFSRIEAGRVQARYEPTDLATLTTELASCFRSATERAGLNLLVDCPPLSEPAYVDPGMWEKIVLNLISNAFKFTFEGQIVVMMQERDGAAELVVRDTGVGIPPEALPRLFERFYRVEKMRSRTHEGTGIGLALVQELVKLHGGTIRVKSSPGQGTTFTVTIPLGQGHLPPGQIANRTAISTAVAAGPFVEEALAWLPEEEPSSRPQELIDDHLYREPSPRSSEGTTAARARILLVDDNRDMRRYVARLLAERYQVESASDGEAALQAINRQRPDLVLSDVMMPKLDGFELLKAIRTDPSLKAIPVILLSARAGEESRIEGMEHGADDYLIKPFSARELLARIAAHLDMARVRHEAADRVSGILNSIKDGFYVIDASYRVLEFNAAAKRIFEEQGLEADALIGTHIFEEVFPDAVDNPGPLALRHTMAERVSTEVEVFYPPWQRWFNIRNFPTPEGGAATFFTDITERKQAEEQRLRLLGREWAAREEAETLNEVSQALSRELDVHTLVQYATDAATKLTAAEFGAFFYNVDNEQGHAYRLYTLSGAPREAFEKLGLPRNTPLFEPTFQGTGVVRIDDVLCDPRYGTMAPYHGMPKGHLPVRSYLAVPVRSRSGEVFGGLFFGHPQPGVFTKRAERFAVSIAAQAAAAIDNARLFSAAQDEIAQRKLAEASLLESEGRFRELVERSPFGIYVVDSAFRIAHMNKAGQLGAFKNVRPVIGRDFSEVMHILWPEPVAAEIIRVFRHTLHTGEPYYSHSFVNRRADTQQTEAYEWELHRWSLPNGEHGVICYYYDFSTLRGVEAGMRDAQTRSR